MRNKVFSRILFLFSGACFFRCDGLSAQETQLPADHAATRETVALFQHLRSITEKGFLFGHQDDLAYGVHWKYQNDRSDVRDVTGDYPALYGWELGRIELDHAVNIDSVPFDRMKGFIRQGYERGGVITISWHCNNPFTGGSAWQPAPGTMAAILPGGEKNALYSNWLDKVAAFLQDLKGPRGESIPVILRIFHELNGDWFWWGGKHATPGEMKELWRFTVRYLRDEKQVHNLLYAYNTDRFDSREAYLEKYPGDEWVDVLGFDIYQGNNISKNEAFRSEFDRTLGTLETVAGGKGKIAALTEFGYNGLPDSLWWTNTFGSVLRRHRLAYAMAWRNAGLKSDGHAEFYVPFSGQASAADFIRFYNDDRTLFQKDISKYNLYQ